MARKLIYEVVMDSAAYTRQIKKVQEQTTAFAASTKKAGRETNNLGRSIKIATGGFIAFQGVQEVLHGVYTGLIDSVAAAREAGVAQRSLTAQMKASGESFSVNRDEIEKVARSYQRFGFNQDQVVQSLTVLERATGSINQAIKLQGVTADLARAKNIDLAAAAAVVGKVFGGQETALRRAVPGLEKHAHGLELIRLASQKLAGQAAANTTQQQKFNASIHNAEVAIGTALLPAVNRLEAAGGAAADKAANFVTNWDKAGNSASDAKIDVDALAKALRGVGHATDFAVGKLGGWGKVFSVWKTAERYSLGITPLANVLKLKDKIFPPDPSARAPTGAADAGAKAAHGLGLAAANAGDYRAAARAATATAKQRNKWFDAMIGRRELRAGLLTSATAQLTAYKAIGAILKRQIAAVHDVTRLNNLKDQALQNAAYVAGLQAQIAADLKSKQDAARQKLQDQIAAAKQEKEDWLAFAYEKAQTTKTVKDDLKAATANLAYWKKQAATGKYTVDEARQVLYWQQQLKDIRNKGKDTDPLAGLFQVGSARLANILAAGTGLGAAGRRRLGFNIAGAEIQPIHVHLNLDGREVASVVAKQQARSGNRTSHQTSGRRG